MKNNVCIWKVENTLDELIQLVKKNYAKDIQIEGTSEVITLDHEWEIVKQLDEIIIDGILIRYISLLAHIEVFKASRAAMVHNGHLLPKEAIVSKKISLVYFAEYLGGTYCIVSGPLSAEPKIRTKLMRHFTADGKNENGWGKVEFNKVSGYIFNKDFYYWLIRNNGKALNIKNEDCDKEMIIKEIKGFKCDAYRKTHQYSGEGGNIDREVTFKTIVSTDKTLTDLYIKILYNDIMYSFSLHENGRLEVYLHECGEHATMKPRTMELHAVILDIYFDIIPFLIFKYNSESDNIEVQVEKFKTQSAIDTVRLLMKEHQIDVNDLNLEDKITS